jgi:hypothetical protein
MSGSSFLPKGKLVALGATTGGHGAVETFSSEELSLVVLAVTAEGEGTLSTFSPEGQRLAGLGTTPNGDGAVATYTNERSDENSRLNPRGKLCVEASSFSGYFTSKRAIQTTVIRLRRNARIAALTTRNSITGCVGGARTGGIYLAQLP